MRSLTLITGALAMAIAAPALADPGKDKGRGGDHRKGHAAGQQKGGDKQNGAQARGKNDRSRGNSAAVARYGAPSRAAPVEYNGKGKGKDKHVEVRTVDRVIYRDTSRNRYAERDRDDRDGRGSNGGFFDRYANARTGIAGCPPGLAKKNNGCLPPGQVTAVYSGRDRYAAFFEGIPYRYRDYRDDGYRYRDGYLYRTNGNTVASYIPLLGGALGVGNLFPVDYYAQPIPDYYASYYGRNDDYAYRYADRAIFAVDPKTRAIQSIAALLTGDDITVGQPMPSGYSAYNVPLAYRDRYYDTPQADYRYANGYVYKIDPTTQLVAAAISLLV